MTKKTLSDYIVSGGGFADMIEVKRLTKAVKELKEEIRHERLLFEDSDILDEFIPQINHLINKIFGEELTK